jgi:hypothetical protein
MVDNEGIRSLFSTQVSTRSPKLHIYESLFLFNQGVDHLAALLRSMVKFSFVDKEEVQAFRAEIEEVRCDMNADFAEYLVDSERSDEARFSKLRHDYEKQRRDPGDVYLNVERREEERKKQGLPPRVGILPHSAVATEEQRWEAEQERKKRRPAKHRKPTPKAKKSGQESSHD